MMEASGPKPGDVLAGRYVLRERIGEGGMGLVFLADQPALARTVAIKVLHGALAHDRAMARRFREEAVAASRVRHPCSIAVFDCNNLGDGTPFMVMEYVCGQPLGRIIAEQVVPVPRALAVVGQILGALEAAHDAGVIHADVKSDNFLVEDVDGTDHVTMIDFGLARVDGVGGVLRNVVSGTPEYMAPEITTGEAPTVASDLYAVGVILYELLTGSTPFCGGTPADILRRQVDDVVVPPSLRQPDRSISAELDRIALRALAKDPRDRFADARTFARALQMATRRARPDTATTTRIPRISHAKMETRDFIAQRRFARGSDMHDREPLERRAIASALLRGDAVEIARGYTALAACLASKHQFAAAMHELEEGIDIVTVGRGPTGTDSPAVDQLVVALAALYEEAGDVAHARSLVTRADRHPTIA